jgi:hypothetical protein
VIGTRGGILYGGPRGSKMVLGKVRIQ